MTTAYVKVGTTSWTVPTGVSSINITIIGAGAQGYGGATSVAEGGSGGNAATSTSINNISVTAGMVIPCSVGAYGTAISNYTSNTSAPWYNAGASGGSTSFGSSGTVGPYSSTGAQDLSAGSMTGTALGGNGSNGGVTGDGSSNAASGGGSGGSGGSGYGSGGGGAHAGTYSGGHGSDGIIVITYTAAVTPVASFTYTPSSGNAPLTVNFTDTSTNTPTSWSWNFGDGTTSTSQNPTHTYSSAGTYTVSLTATNAAGSSSPVTHTVSVTSSPVAAFVMNPENIGPVQMANTSAIYTQKIKLFDQSTVVGSIINQWSWSCSAAGASFSPSATAQNPVLTIPAVGSPAAFTVSLTVTTSAGVTSSTTTKTVYQQSTLITKPLASDYYKNISIFLYSPPVPASVPSGVTTPCATVLNRARTTNNNLFFTDFQCTGSISKAGTLTFTAVDLGKSTATERYLMTAAGTYVVVVVGYSVVWSGQILRAVNSVSQLYTGTIGYAQYAIECESDIGKMKTQYVAASAQGLTTGSTGAIVSKLVQANLSTDPNWNGAVDPSIISREGNQISYTITSGDMYDQFITLANSSGFDWRTRMQTVINTYSTWSSPTLTLSNAIGNYGAGNYAGKWVLFPGSSTSGIVSWGYCSSNASATALTLSSVQNPTLIPASSGRAIVLIGPVLDYAWSLEPPMPCLTLLANAPSNSTSFQALNFSDNSDYKSLATVVTVKAKTLVPTQGTGVGSTITSTLYAKDQWDSTYNFFKHSTYVTQRMDGYVYSKGVSSQFVVLIGQGYALQVGDTFYAYPIYPNGTTSAIIGPKTITGVSTQTQTDGTRTTTVTTGGNIDSNGEWSKYSVFISVKTYVADPVWLTNSYSMTCYVGGSPLNQRQFSAQYIGTSADPVYGNYVIIPGTGAFPAGAIPIPAFPGTLISWTGTDSGSPGSQSPLKYYGSILYTQTVDSSITQSDLDVYASQYLVNKSYYLRKASVTAKLIMDYCAPGWRKQYETYDPHMVREGNLITVLTSSSVSPGNDPTAQWPDGQYRNRWQVMSWTLDGSTMQVTCELGDYEKNTYTLMQQLTSSTNQTLT